MKKILLLLILTASFINCNYSFESELKSQKENDAELKAIEKSGRSLYDWFFENNYGYIDVSEGKKGKCSLDTLAYFNGLRSLGTISERFITIEKERVSECAEFMPTLKYSKFMKSDVFDYQEHCPELYYMYWVSGQINPDSYSVKNVKMINATHASMDIYLIYGETEESSTQILLEKENNIWKITAVNFIKK